MSIGACGVQLPLEPFRTVPTATLPAAALRQGAFIKSLGTCREAGCAQAQLRRKAERTTLLKPKADEPEHANPPLNGTKPSVPVSAGSEGAWSHIVLFFAIRRNRPHEPSSCSDPRCSGVKAGPAG